MVPMNVLHLGESIDASPGSNMGHMGGCGSQVSRHNTNNSTFHTIGDGPKAIEYHIGDDEHP